MIWRITRITLNLLIALFYITSVLGWVFANFIAGKGRLPGRSAHQAVRAARNHVAAGKRWVVDIDLEKFFDRVNRDILMSLVKRKVKGSI